MVPLLLLSLLLLVVVVVAFVVAVAVVLVMVAMVMIMATLALVVSVAMGVNMVFAVTAAGPGTRVGALLVYPGKRRGYWPAAARTNPDPPALLTGKQNTGMQENWEPNFSCEYERRLGQPGDGGKWVCDPHKLSKEPDCLVYSLGSNNAFDFEEAIHEGIGLHCEIHTFDHTVGNHPSNKPSQVNFHPWGIGSDRTGNLKALDQMAEDLGHLGRRIHILKIDVEGAEFKTLPGLLNSGAFEKLGIQQVLIEVHRSTPAVVHALMEAFHRAGYAIFHKEANIQYPMSAVDVCVEFGFIKLGGGFWS